MHKRRAQDGHTSAALRTNNRVVEYVHICKAESVEPDIRRSVKIDGWFV